MIGVCMNIITENDKHKQLNLKTEKARHGEGAIKALIKEFSQFDEKNIFDPKKANSLTNVEKLGALNLLTMLKKKDVVL